jgi:hypothetical protein
MKEEIEKMYVQALIDDIPPNVFADQVLRLFSVSGRSEHLKCKCKKPQFSRTVDSDFNPLCGRCGKSL